MKFRRNGDSLWLWCPACDDSHRITVGAPHGWQWNDQTMTVSPSIKVTGVQWPRNSPFYKPRHRSRAGEAVVCHSFVENGSWRFLTDSTHELAGQTVPLVDLPDWLGR